ncbi:MAG TPA: DUF2130 domain-containing protein [Candidatus Acidoferrales bacterium]|nr:DUF2130 domain-containing protein [Candidatus Acidoferrales bacterium]
MTEPTIICSNCKSEIRLTQSLAAPLIEETRREYEKRLKQQDVDIAKREAALREQERALAKARESIEDQLAERLKHERALIVEQEARKAKQVVAIDLDQKSRQITQLQEILEQRNVKLEEAQKAQADLLRKQRELDDAKREMELTIERRVQHSLSAIRDQARKEVHEELKLTIAERELTIASMQKQIEELKRRAEQGSQQLQGEVQEIELEALLSARFPSDTIEPVPKGEHGGDVLQRVIGPLGQSCGTILWESKRTKNWSDSWLTKLRADQRAANAELAIVVTQALPKDVEAFDLIDGVWVAHRRVAIPVAVSLRQSLVELTMARQASEGQQTKMEMVYQYLTGTRFRQRVQAIVEAFSSMQEDLAREKRALTKQWAKREQQIEQVMQATVGMYGDLQGIAGKTLQEIEGLEVRALEALDADEHG